MRGFAPQTPLTAYLVLGCDWTGLWQNSESAPLSAAETVTVRQIQQQYVISEQQAQKQNLVYSIRERRLTNKLY